MTPDLKAAAAAQKRLLSTPLFANVGQPDNLKDFPNCGKVRFVESWEDAIKQASRSDYWIYPGTVSTNSCRTQVCNHFGDDWFDDNWGKICDKMKSLELKSLSGLFKYSAKEAAKHIESNIFEKVKYDLICIIMEHVCFDVLSEKYFIDIIEPFYLAGHFPCGWNGKKVLKSVKDISTKGELIVF